MKQGRISVTVFAMLRFFLSAPIVLVFTSLVIWLSVIVLPPRGKVSVLYVFSRIGLAILCIVVSAIIIRRKTHKIPCKCSKCGGQCFAEPKASRIYKCESCGASLSPAIDPSEFFGGIITSLMGLAVIIIWFFYLFSEKKYNGPAWAFLAMLGTGLIFFTLGLHLIGVLGLLAQGLSKRWKWIKTTNWGFVFGAAVCTGLGLMFIAISFDPGQADNMPSGRWPVFAAGFTFFIAGALMGVKLILGKRRMSSYIAMILTTLLLLGFAAVPIFIAANEISIKKVPLIPIFSGLIILALISLIWYKFMSTRRKNEKKDEKKCE